MLEEQCFLASMKYTRISEEQGTWQRDFSYEIFEVQKGKRPIEADDEEDQVITKISRNSGDAVDTTLSIEADEDEDEVITTVSVDSGDDVDTTLSIGGILNAVLHQIDLSDDNSDTSSLIGAIGRDNSISCLIQCSRSDYGSIALLNKSFRSLIRSGEIYKLRLQKGVVEHWVFFSCEPLEWEAFDPERRRWMHLPKMIYNFCFVYSDKESLAVGTQLLVFGRDAMSQIIYQYSLLNNTWTTGTPMNQSRCLFGSASLGDIAILAGGCDYSGKLLSSAELYSSETGTWTMLPSLNKPRKLCSGAFMDGKFYVIGGIGGAGSEKLLTCGEEYDLETKTWTEIPNMCPVHPRDGDPPATSEAPPLVAVVNNELYAADYREMAVRKYNKSTGDWITLGRLPEHADSMFGWGLAFRACGNRLMVIGGPKKSGECFVEVSSWVPGDGPPHWEVLGRKKSQNFVYNCAVMGC